MTAAYLRIQVDIPVASEQEYHDLLDNDKDLVERIGFHISERYDFDQWLVNEDGEEIDESEIEDES